MNIQDVLLRPIVTEKSTASKQQGFYSFIVSPRANKILVKEAVKKLFKVDVLDCKIIVTKPKHKALRTRRGYGKTASFKKAMVKLKKDQTIAALDS